MGAEILFYHLMVKADDFGVYFGNEQIIKNTCFPLKSSEIKLKQVESWLNELVKAGLLFEYIAEDGKKYVQFTKWAKHQQIRAKKSKYPSPDEGICNQMISNDIKCPRNPIQSESNSISESESNAKDARKAREEAFEKFWSAYPRKEGKQKAKAAFEKVNVPLDVLLNAIEQQKESAQWSKDNGQFIPHPTTWLNGKRWEDEVVMAGNAQMGARGHLGAAEKAAIQRLLAESEGA